ncbi:MAG: hypothetical protein A2Z38_03860 [Planctomycetes bacterium RBG_19FT_COMBO_48_8]|nr:MAG: hypothetical protein A2167_02425 [Planctomycetes bacterium RBG_13_46_10]OHB84133.1 MAG: hypothetical protein A2Z38_03860 [Planctomycetes bacterium RBG_19FT_COMBO_48_8]
MSSCIFCKILAGEIPAAKIYEDDVVLAFLDIGPISDGHTLMMPRQHIETLHDCPSDILGQICSRLGKIAGAVAKAMNSDGYNVLCNNGGAAGQVVEHLHFHIIPRKTGDKLFHHWPSYKYRQGQTEDIVTSIKKNL